MELDRYTASLPADLLAAASLGDDHTRKTAEALANAAQASARLMLLEAMSEFADEISDRIDGYSVHLKLSGNEASADVIREAVDEAAERSAGAIPSDGDEYPTMDDVTGEVRRVTLRMVEHVKERAEQAASMNGVSLNSWLSQAVQDALREQVRNNRTRY